MFIHFPLLTHHFGIPPLPILGNPHLTIWHQRNEMKKVQLHRLHLVNHRHLFRHRSCAVFPRSTQGRPVLLGRPMLEPVVAERLPGLGCPTGKEHTGIMGNHYERWWPTGVIWWQYDVPIASRIVIMFHTWGIWWWMMMIFFWICKLECGFLINFF